MVRILDGVRRDAPVRGGGSRVFLDRHTERAALDQLIEAVQAGASQALVVAGDAGVGKTVLLDYVAGRASGCRVLRAAGVQSEMELAFAGLHQLCAPLLKRLEQLPGPQGAALGTAFGLNPGVTPDRFLIGLGVLNLFAEGARERPLLCVVDDAQWLDRASAQALAFVARRLGAESVAFVFAVRAPDEVPELTALPCLWVEGLPSDAARALLGSVVRGLDERVLDRIVAETRGNPLALLELPRGLTPAELVGGFVLPTAPGLPSRIEHSYRRRLDGLPTETKRLLLVAACEPLGDPVVVWRAAERLGVGPHAAAPAAEAGLVQIGSQVRFHHPLVRSAIYQAASLPERRDAHAALAEATDGEVDPDRRAWHRAQAAVGPDEAVAAELERSARRAQARGGPIAATAFLEKAAELTLEPAHRAQRTLAAAEATHQAGNPEEAFNLLSIAEAGPLDALQQAHADVLRARISFIEGRVPDAAPLLLRAARQLTPLNVQLARETYLEAIFAAWVASGVAGPGDVVKVAQATRVAPPATPPPRAIDLLLDGLATRLTDGCAAGAPTLKRALSALIDSRPQKQQLRWLTVAMCVAGDVWDDLACELISTRHVQLARDAGAFSELPTALTGRIWVHLHAGEVAAATSLVEEVHTLSEATGSRLAPYGALALAVWRGHEAEAVRLFEAIGEHAPRRGEGAALAAVRWAKAQLYNSLGRYQDAMTAVSLVAEQPHQTPHSGSGLVELIEAAIRCGSVELALDALERLTESTLASGTSWALGIQARSRALITDGDAAEEAYQESIAYLGRTRVPTALARAHLLYGEWLRRENRRLDARQQLRTAHDMFTAMGAQAFARRAVRELNATGATARKRGVETTSELTAQEAQIVQLVREGLSNPEIGARLFISPRTVEWHLSRIFGKLHVTSRRQLRR